MEKDLRRIGLTENETNVYLSLLKLGETQVGGIIGDLKLHRQIIYNALDALERKGMVRKYIRNKIFHFKIADPKIIVENIRIQELVAERLSRKIVEERKKSQHDREIEVFDGSANIKRFYLESIHKCPAGSSFFVLGGYAPKMEEILGADLFYGEYQKLREKRKISSKHLCSEYFRDEILKVHQKIGRVANVKREVRFLPYKLTDPATTTIFPESVSFQMFFGDPFVIEIRNRDIRNSYLKHFDFLWKIAKK